MGRFKRRCFPNADSLRGCAPPAPDDVGSLGGRFGEGADRGVDRRAAEEPAEALRRFAGRDAGAGARAPGDDGVHAVGGLRARAPGPADARAPARTHGCGGLPRRRQSVSNTQFVSYDVLVQVDGHRWVVHRRYKDFRALDDGIKKLDCSPPKLPGKQMFGNFEDNFIEQRRCDLEAYLQAVVDNDDTRAHTVRAPRPSLSSSLARSLARADATAVSGHPRIPRRADPPAREPRLLSLRDAIRPIHARRPRVARRHARTGRAPVAFRRPPVFAQPFSPGRPSMQNNRDRRDAACLGCSLM